MLLLRNISAGPLKDDDSWKVSNPKSTREKYKLLAKHECFNKHNFLVSHKHTRKKGENCYSMLSLPCCAETNNNLRVITASFFSDKISNIDILNSLNLA